MNKEIFPQGEVHRFNDEEAIKEKLDEVEVQFNEDDHTVIPFSDDQEAKEKRDLEETKKLEKIELRKEHDTLQIKFLSANDNEKIDLGLRINEIEKLLGINKN